MRLIAFGGRIVNDEPEIARGLADLHLGEVAIGSVSSRFLDGRLGMEIDREGIARRIQRFPFWRRTTLRNQL
jgi:hypothetical protein